jgi:hypothetical protein
MVMGGIAVGPTGSVSFEWFPEVRHERTDPMGFMLEQLAKGVTRRIV